MARALQSHPVLQIFENGYSEPQSLKYWMQAIIISLSEDVLLSQS